MRSRAAGWTLALLAGGVWGVAFFSWGLPLSIPARVAATVLLVLAMSLASAAGRLAAGAFTLGMAVISGVVVSGTAEFLEWGSALVVVAVVASVALHAGSLLGTRDP